MTCRSPSECSRENICLDAWHCAYEPPRHVPACTISRSAAVTFLREAAGYFERRDTKGEDAAHWSNVTNAENCRKIANAIERGFPPHP